MRALRSVRVRIIALYMAILLLTLSTFGFVLFRDLSRRLRGDIDKLLESRAQGVADSVNAYWEAEKLEAAWACPLPRPSPKTLEELNVPLTVF